ncbi:unnamed protein product, partial [Ceratitis capitata]
MSLAVEIVLLSKRQKLNLGKSAKIKKKCLQLNLNHCQAAQDLLAQTVQKKHDSCWVSNRTINSAIWYCNANASPINMIADSDGF